MEASISWFPAPPTVGVDGDESYVALVGMTGLQVIKKDCIVSPGGGLAVSRQ